MIESIKHADEQMPFFREIEGLDEDTINVIRLELITAFRKGYELATRKGNAMFDGYSHDKAIRTVEHLSDAIAGLPANMEVGFCSYNGGHVFEIGAAAVEQVDEGDKPSMFMLYTKPSEEAILKK